MGPSDLSVWWGEDNAASLNALATKVRTLRIRAAKIKDACSREAYIGWADYYDHEIAEARSEIRDHHEQRSMEAYDAQRRREAAAARAAHIEPLP